MGECIMSMHIMTSYMTKTIYKVLKMALSSMIYIIHDVIMCSNIIHFPVFIS